MYFTLRLVVQRKVDNRVTKNFYNFSKAFGNFQFKCKTGYFQDLYQMNYNVNTEGSNLSYLFASSDIQYLSLVKQNLEALLFANGFVKNDTYRFYSGEVVENLG